MTQKVICIEKRLVFGNMLQKIHFLFFQNSSKLEYKQLDKAIFPSSKNKKRVRAYLVLCFLLIIKISEIFRWKSWKKRWFYWEKNHHFISLRSVKINTFIWLPTCRSADIQSTHAWTNLQHKFKNILWILKMFAWQSHNLIANILFYYCFFRKRKSTFLCVNLSDCQQNSTTITLSLAYLLLSPFSLTIIITAKNKSMTLILFPP